MAKSVQKITLSQSRDIPFNRLLLSQSNVRRIKAGVSIEELAQDIARRTLLQSLSLDLLTRHEAGAALFLWRATLKETRSPKPAGRKTRQAADRRHAARSSSLFARASRSSRASW